MAKKPSKIFPPLADVIFCFSIGGGRHGYEVHFIRIMRTGFRGVPVYDVSVLSTKTGQRLIEGWHIGRITDKAAESLLSQSLKLEDSKDAKH